MLFNIFKSQLWILFSSKFRGGTILHASNIWTLGAAPLSASPSSIALCNIVLHTPFHSHTHGLWNPILIPHVVCVPCHVRVIRCYALQSNWSRVWYTTLLLWVIRLEGLTCCLKEQRLLMTPQLPLHPLILARYELLSLHDTTNCCLFTGVASLDHT